MVVVGDEDLGSLVELLVEPTGTSDARAADVTDATPGDNVTGRISIGFSLPSRAPFHEGTAIEKKP